MLLLRIMRLLESTMCSVLSPAKLVRNAQICNLSLTETSSKSIFFFFFLFFFLSATKVAARLKKADTNTASYKTLATNTKQ